MEAILKSHSLATLKKEISKTNLKKYSKMKKAEVVELMLKHKEKFGHIKFNSDKKFELKVKEDKKRQKKNFERAMKQVKKENRGYKNQL